MPGPCYLQITNLADLDTLAIELGGVNMVPCVTINHGYGQAYAVRCHCLYTVSCDGVVVWRCGGVVVVWWCGGGGPGGGGVVQRGGATGWQQRRGGNTVGWQLDTWQFASGSGTERCRDRRPGVVEGRVGGGSLRRRQRVWHVPGPTSLSDTLPNSSSPAKKRAVAAIGLTPARPWQPHLRPKYVSSPGRACSPPRRRPKGGRIEPSASRLPCMLQAFCTNIGPIG